MALNPGIGRALVSDVCALQVDDLQVGHVRFEQADTMIVRHSQGKSKQKRMQGQ